MSDVTWDWEDQLEEVQTGMTRNDRVSAVLVVLLTLLAVGVGIAMRQRASGQEWTYVSRAAGIEAAYPAGWLVDESGDYIVRIRDPKGRPFKTQYRIATVPAGGQTSIRNVLDGLTIQRSTDLAAYRVVSVQEQTIAGQDFTVMNFTFVDADPNPFVQRLPTVVLGMDVVIRDADRAIVVTYMADEEAFATHYDDFQSLLAALRY